MKPFYIQENSRSFFVWLSRPTVGLRQQERKSFIRIDNEILGLTGIERNNYCQQATVMHTGYNL